MRTITAWREDLWRKQAEAIRSHRRIEARRTLRIWFNRDAMRWEANLGIPLSVADLETMRADLTILALNYVLRFKRLRGWGFIFHSRYANYNNRSLARAWFLSQIT